MAKHGRQGDGGGQPPKYKSAKLLRERIDEFFELCDDKRQLPEKAGLCVFLDISRDTYSEYRKKYPDTIRYADGYIESNWVRRLGGQSATGAIFYLKNAFDYRDKTETELSGNLSLVELGKRRAEAAKLDQEDD